MGTGGGRIRVRVLRIIRRWRIVLRRRIVRSTGTERSGRKVSDEVDDTQVNPRHNTV